MAYRSINGFLIDEVGQAVGVRDPFGKEAFFPARLSSEGQAKLSELSLVGGMRRSYVPFKTWGAAQNSAGLLGVTNQAVYEIPFDWLALRVHVENMAATAQINRLAAVAVSNDAIASPSTPSGTFNNLLFSGTAAHATAACTSGAGTNNAVPTDLVSDLLVLPSIPRTDGGSGRLLFYRETVPAAGNTTGNRADIASTTLALSVTKVKAYFKAGDFVTTPAGFTTPTEWTMAPTVWFEFLTATGQMVLLAAGDSIMQGSDGGPMPNIGGAPRRVFEALSGRLAFANEGWVSQTSAAYYTNGVAKLASTRPTFGAFCPWSVNDSDAYTQAGVNRCNVAALSWIRECQAVGAIPLLVTPGPINSITSTDEGFRRQVVNFVKSVCAAGLAQLVDRDAVYTNYASAAGGFLPGLNATAFHPNEAGYLREAETAWLPVLGSF